MILLNTVLYSHTEPKVIYVPQFINHSLLLLLHFLLSEEARYEFDMEECLAREERVLGPPSFDSCDPACFGNVLLCAPQLIATML